MYSIELEMRLTGMGLSYSSDQKHHLKFKTAESTGQLAQNLANAITNMESHATSKRHGQAKAFAESITVGFDYAKKTLGEEYRTTILPKLEKIYEELKEKYSI